MRRRTETPAGLMSIGGHRADEHFPDLRRPGSYCRAGRGLPDRRREIRHPGDILLLPAGFAAGTLTMVVNPDKIFGAAFPPLVSLAVAVVLFDGGLDLAARGWRAATAAWCAGCAAGAYR
jgi:hypothetical protein